MKIKILLVGNDENIQTMSRLLKSDEIEIVGLVRNETKVLDEISRCSPDIVMLCLDQGSIALRICQQIYLLRPRCIPILLSDNPSPENLHRAMEVGVHHVLPYTTTSERFVAQIKSIYTNESTRLSALDSGSNSSWKSRVIMIFGTKGGIGKTTLAVNLAVKLAQRKCKVALLDFDLQFGDANVFFGIETKDTLSELLQEQNTPTTDTIRRYLTIHKTGVNVLCAPRSPEFAEGISAVQIEKIISSLRTYYDYIIIDTAATFSEINLSCIDASTQVLFVSGLDISLLRNTKKGIALLESLQAKGKLKLIINREIQGSIKLSGVERSLGYPVWFSIPNDYKVAVTALNQGDPLVLNAPYSKISKQIGMIAAGIDEDNSSLESTGKQKKQKRKLWGK